jgi:hypothetical protein
MNFEKNFFFIEQHINMGILKTWNGMEGNGMEYKIFHGV